MSASGTDSAQASDDVASGDGGYKDSLNGASTRDMGAWVTGTRLQAGRRRHATTA